MLGEISVVSALLTTRIHSFVARAFRRRDRLFAVEGRAYGFRGGVVGGHALGSWWARLLEAVVVLDLLGHDVRALEVFHGGDSVLSPSVDMKAKRLWIGTVHRIPRR